MINLGEPPAAELSRYAATASRFILGIGAALLLLVAPTPTISAELIAVVDLTYVESTEEPSNLLCLSDQPDDCSVWGTYNIYRAKILKVIRGVESRKTITVLLGHHGVPARPIRNVVARMKTIDDAKPSEPSYKVIGLGSKRELYCIEGQKDLSDGLVLSEGNDNSSTCYESK